jgi:hypothetical protein
LRGFDCRSSSAVFVYMELRAGVDVGLETDKCIREGLFTLYHLWI